MPCQRSVLSLLFLTAPGAFFSCATVMGRGSGARPVDASSQESLRFTALLREVTEEIACEIRISHLIGIYAKPYRDDLVLSFHATLISGVPQPCVPEISGLVFSARDSLPHLAFTRRIRIEDAFEGRRGIVRVFDSADSLAPSFDTDVLSHTKA